MSVFINPDTLWNGPGPNYQLLNQLCHDLDQVFDRAGINGCVCFENEMLREGTLKYIKDSNHDIYLVLCTEHNAIEKKSSSGKMRSWYQTDRLKLNDLAANKTIILASAQNNDCLDGPELPNIYRIHISGAAMLVDYHEYCKLKPVYEKNFSSHHHWVSLSHGMHHHRVMMAMILLGYDLGMDQSPQGFGKLHISPILIENMDTWRDFWDGSHTVTTQQDFRLTKGFKRFKQNENGGQPDGNYLNHNYKVENPRNFDLCLRHLYSDTVFEIINDTTYYNPAGTTHNEKYVNSILGLNIPLVLSNTGAVKVFRNLGFDVFDDVVNHSYDQIKNPIDRMFALVESNLELLTNQDLARTCWIKCIPRLLDNVKRYHGLYNQIKVSAMQDLQDTLAVIQHKKNYQGKQHAQN